MRVKDIMTRHVYTVHATDTVEHAAAVLAEHQITAAPVYDAGGELVGMVSEGDLLWHRVPLDPTAHLWPVTGRVDEDRPRSVVQVMSRGPVSTWPEADVADAAQLMLDRDLRSLPVVVDGDVVGIVSRRDILRTMVRTDDVLCRDVQYRLDEYAGGEPRWTVTVEDGVATVKGPLDDPTERDVIAVLARTVAGVSAVYLGRAGPY
jgi:CBS domain-containing protein